MEAVDCPYCGATNHSSAPEIMAECAYCGIPFAEVRSPYMRLTVIDGHLPDAWDRAENLKTHWQEDGDLDRDVIVDRRLDNVDFMGPERRRIIGNGLPVRPFIIH